MTAWESPPMYWSTGVHRAVMLESNGRFSLRGSQYRKKYHDESTNVSIVSVSRRAGRSHFGHVVFTNPATPTSGDSPVPVKSAVSGNSTGNWSIGTGTMPQCSQ